MPTKMQGGATAAATASTAAKGGKPKNKRFRKRRPTQGGGGGGGGTVESSSSQAGGSSKKGGGGSSSKGHKNNVKKDRGPPPPPQLKVTLRNIGDVEKYGTVAKLGDLVSAIISRVNESGGATPSPLSESGVTTAGINASTATSIGLHLEEESLERLIRIEEAVTAARTELYSIPTIPNADNKGDDANADAGQKSVADQKQQQLNQSSSLSASSGVATATTANSSPLSSGKNLVNASAKTSSMTANSPPVATASATSVTVRFLYAVPPKKTRRRGEKPGNVYLILQSSPILPFPASTPPPVVSVSSTPTNMGESKDGGDASSATKPPNSASNNKRFNNKKTQSQNYNHELSKRRALLMQAVQAMSFQAQLDAGTIRTAGAIGSNAAKTGGAAAVTGGSQQISTSNSKSSTGSGGIGPGTSGNSANAIVVGAGKFRGCTVEESLNGKTWKITTPDDTNATKYNKNRRNSSINRLEGTIFESADYKQFQQDRIRQEEERKARPRPIPGGGMAVLQPGSNQTSLGGTNSVSAIANATVAGGAGAAAVATAIVPPVGVPGIAAIDKETGQPVSFLVQHLLSKQQEAAQKKKKKPRKPSKQESQKGVNASSGAKNSMDKKKKIKKKPKKVVLTKAGGSSSGGVAKPSGGGAAGGGAGG